MPSINIDVRKTLSAYKNSNTALFTICSHVDKNPYTYKIINEYTRGNHVKYCNKNDYDYYFFDDVSIFESLNFLNNDEVNYSHCLTKFEAFIKLFEREYDNVFYIDASDVLITNIDKELEEFKNKENSVFLSTKSFVYDWENAIRNDNINGGFIGAKNNDESKEILYKSIEKVKEKSKNIDLNENDIFDDVIWKEVLNENNFDGEVSIGNPLQQKYWLSDRAFHLSLEEIINQHERIDVWSEGDFMVHLGVFCDLECSKLDLIERFYEYYLE